MKKKVMVLCMLLLSGVAIGKVSLIVAQHSVQEKYVAQEVRLDDVEKSSQTPQEKHDVLLRSSAWLMSELIPSAEAAKSIPLEEEKRVQDSQENMSDFQRRMNKLLEKEEALDERELAVKDAEERAATSIATLEALQTRIKSLLQEEESIKDKKIKRLTSVYEGMKAERAAPVIAQMELSIVVKMFLRMNEKQVGKILSYLPPQQAVVISQALTQRVSSLN